MSSPLTKGMISKAILQSGVGLSYDHMLAAAEQEGVEFAANAGVKSLKEMRALDFGQIMEAANPIIMRGFPTMRLPYTPVIDGIILEDGYNSAMELGITHDIPYIVGSTLNDIATTPGELAKGERGKVYEGSKKWCVEQLNKERAPAYLYYFTRRLPGDDAGAFHSSELWYTFGTYGRCWRPMTEGDEMLSERMVDYWTNFMKTGDPNGDGLPQWKPYRSDDDIMLLDA